MRTETIVFYTLAMVVCGVAIILTACKQANYGALLSSMTVLILVVSLSVTGGCCGDDEQVVVEPSMVLPPFMPPPPLPPAALPLPRASPAPRAARFALADPNTWTPQVHSGSAVAEVTNNAYVGPTFSPRASKAKDMDYTLMLPLQMEGQCNKFDAMSGNVASCGTGFKIVPNMPPMPGMAQLHGQSGVPGEVVWRLPEYPVDQPSREETIAAVVSDLPTCSQQTPKDIIRNQGLYGIKGNLSCDLLKRSTVSDHGFLEPLAARNAFLAYNSYDQLHAKDQFLIPVNKKQPE
jgi:hypothetical protein